jgi:hypothetical protein
MVLPGPWHTGVTSGDRARGACNDVDAALMSLKGQV